MRMTGIWAAATLLAVGVTQAHAQESVDLEIGYMPILPVAQLFVGLEQGWLSEAGITPELVQFQNGPAMVQALLSGQLDVAYFGIGPAMVARARSADIKVVASNIMEQISIVALGDLAPYFDTDPKTAFARFAADKGRKAVISTFPSGSVPDTVLQYWLQKQLAIDPDQIEIIYQGAAQVQQSLLTGAIDGAAILEPVVSTVIARAPQARVVASGSELFPKQPGAILAVRGATIAEHPETVQALVAAHVRATTMLRDQPEKAAADVGKYLGGGRLDPAVVLTAIKRSHDGFVADPNAIIEGTREMQAFQKTLGSLSADVDLNALFDTRFYDNLGQE